MEKVKSLDSAKPMDNKMAEPMQLKPPVVKAVSSQEAAFRPHPSKPFVGGTVDICKAHPCKGV